MAAFHIPAVFAESVVLYRKKEQKKRKKFKGMDNNKKTSTYVAYAPHVLNLLEKACVS